MFFYLNIKGTTKVCQIKNPNNKAAIFNNEYFFSFES